MATKSAATAANAAGARRNVVSEIAVLTRALKAPSLAGAVERLAGRARTEGWTHEEFLAACLQREVAAREAHGGEGRIRAARFPARKSLEDFDFDHQRSLKRDAIDHACSATAAPAHRPTAHPTGTCRSALQDRFLVPATGQTLKRNESARRGDQRRSRSHTS